MDLRHWRRSGALLAIGLLALAPAACDRSGPATPAWGPTSTVTGPTPADPTTTAAPAPSPTATDTPRPAPAPAAPVTVLRTGGFAGVTQKLVVETDGAWRYADARGPGGGAQTGRLGAAQRERLRQLLADPSFGSAFYPGGCRDGFHYSLVVGSQRVEWDDCGRDIPARAAQAIVALLAETTPL